MGAKEYLEVMQDVVKLWLDSNYPVGNYCWQQDSAPVHKANKTQEWCKEELASFWPRDLWPPSSPDCSQLASGAMWRAWPAPLPTEVWTT